MGEGKTRGSQAPADAPGQGKGPRSIVRPPDAETPKRSVAAALSVLEEQKTIGIVYNSDRHPPSSYYEYHKHYYTPLAAAAEGPGTTRGWSWPWR